jgi:hypothetical protein
VEDTQMKALWFAWVFQRVDRCRWCADATAVVVLVLACHALWTTAPAAGDFAWSDAPRHALNGIFVLDAAKALPLQDPRAWAEHWYLQYPALSIFFYPPLFSAILAVAYWIIGISHGTAQTVVAVFHFLLMSGVFVLARRWLPVSYALGAALALGAAPEVALWARQVMLDIPAYAWLVWSLVALFQYVKTERAGYAYLTAASYACALYTKQTAVFAVVPMVALIVQARGPRIFLDRHLLTVFAVFSTAMIPLVLLHLAFGSVNTASALGSARQDASRLSIEAWSYYGSILPSQLGWPMVLLAATYLSGAGLSRSWRIERVGFRFLLVWLVSGYAFFSAIMVREPRHDLMALWPLTIFGMLAVWKFASLLDSRRAEFFGAGLALALGFGTVAWSMDKVAVPFVSGYRELAEFVVEHAPPNSYVLFNGYRDGTFIFDVRVLARPDLGVIRADKLLLRLSIERERGVDVVDVDRATLVDYLRRFRIRYVVSQEDFWTDLKSMRLLNSVLADPAVFAEVKKVRTNANYANTDKVLTVYKYLGDLEDQPEKLSLEMVGIGMTFSQ